MIDKGDALCAPADITPHSLVPQFVICAGGGFGTLGVDHQLLMVGVFIQSGCGGQEVCPALVAAGDL